jgi:hypothetical protein
VNFPVQKFIAASALTLLAACASTPLEDDARYVRLARVVDVHEFTEAERKEARKTVPPANDGGVGFGFGLGYGTGGGFGGVMLGATTPLGGGRNHRYPPNAAFGANRFTVQPVNTSERIEVMSYGKYKVGDCVKLMSGHPSEYARLFDLKPGEQCN